MSCQPSTEKVTSEKVPSEVSSSETTSTTKPELTNPPEGQTFFIGTYSRNEGWVNGKGSGIYKAILEPSGKITIAGTYPSGPNPSYLTIHPSKKWLYAVNEVGGTEEEPAGKIEAFQIDENLRLSHMNDISTEGIAPCYVSANKYGTAVYTANYGSGNVLLYSVLGDGKIGPASSVITFTGQGPTDRQTESHAHFIAEGPNGKVYTTDLGADSVRIYNIVASKFEINESIALTAGSGPRHIVFHPNLDIIYVINELNGTIESFKSDGKKYLRIEILSTTADQNGTAAGCSDVHITADGRFLYAANRGNYNTIAMFEVNKIGKLKYLGQVPTMGEVPRNFAIDPSGKFLLVANQNSDNIVTYSINEKSGLLENPINNTGINTPVCIQFY
jgi:6-phosphogluconolactonase